MPDRLGNPLPGEPGSAWNPGQVGHTGMHHYSGGSANPWLQTAMGNTNNPNLNYDSYLTGLGFDVDSDKVGKYFSGITQQYGEDLGMARAGFGQGIEGLQSQATGQAMQLGGGQGISSAYNPGFGKAQNGIQQGLQGIGQQHSQGLQAGLLGYTGDLQSAERSMQSSFRDVATGLLGRDSAGISWGGGLHANLSRGGAVEGGGTTSYGGDSWNPAGWTGGDPNEGASHIDENGQNWIFRGGRWRES